MKSKITILTAVLVVISLIAYIGCGKKAVEEKTEKVETTKAATDDNYVELWAQSTYLGEKYQQDPVKLSKELQKVYEKLGIASEAYSKWTAEWQKKLASDPQKAGQEWNKLMQKYNLRLAELKK